MIAYEIHLYLADTKRCLLLKNKSKFATDPRQIIKNDLRINYFIVIYIQWYIYYRGVSEFVTSKIH